MPVIYPNTADDSKVLAQRLIELAGDDHAVRVQVVTDGDTIPGYLIDDDLLAALEGGEDLDLDLDDDDDDDQGDTTGDDDQGADNDATTDAEAAADAEAVPDVAEQETTADDAAVIAEPVVDLTALDAPNRGASRDDWAEFMATVPGAGPTEGKTRNALIAEWESLLAATPE